jgi:hypothetical protein
VSASKRIKKFARKQTFDRTFAVLGERTFPALFLPPWLNADSAPSHHDRIREPASAFTAPKAQILERPVALAAIDDCLQVSGRLMVAGLAPHEGDEPAGRQTCARSWEVVCHLMRPVLSCPVALLIARHLVSKLGRLAVAISGRPFSGG